MRGTTGTVAVATVVPVVALVSDDGVVVTTLVLTVADDLIFSVSGSVCAIVAAADNFVGEEVPRPPPEVAPSDLKVLVARKEEPSDT